MKVLLCLLSDQHIPNLLSIHHFQPDRLVLVETGKMKQQKSAENLLLALKLGHLDYHDRCDIESLKSEDELEAVRKVLDLAYEKYPSADWIANVTGGTKPMCIAAYEFFKEKGARVVYTNVGKPNIFMGLKDTAKETGQYKITIEEFLTGYGFKNTYSSKVISDQWINCANAIAREKSDNLKLLFDDKDRKKARKSGIEIKTGKLTIESASLASIVRDTFSLNGNGTTEPLHGRIEKDEAEFLTGGWLEVFFWDVLRRHADTLGIWDVQLGLSISQKTGPTTNELDVAFMNNYGLQMLECKSGSQSHDPNTDILYKVEAIKRQFGAIRVRSFLATTSANVTKDGVKNRAALYHCDIITAAEICQLANDCDSPDLIRKLMFQSKEKR
jgi:hypothetical protein